MNVTSSLLLWVLTNLHVVFSAVLVVLVLLRKKEPVSTVAWVLGVVFIPYVGGLAFLIFGNNRVERKVHRKRLSNAEISPLLPTLARYHGLSPDGDGAINQQLMGLANRIAGTRPTARNHVDVLLDTNRTYGLQEQAIREAKHHVHLEYYIFQPDETGRRFRDLLIDKAGEGVRVRLLYDAVGSSRLRKRFLAPLEEAGAEVACFLSVNPLRRRLIINLRNHRKILIVDGRTAFTGGVNIGNEYVGRSESLGYWRDTHLRLQGPSVLQLQQIFAEDWYFATDRELVATELYPPPEEPGRELVHVVAGGPDRGVEVFHELFFTAITTARQRIRLETSYFVPTSALQIALETAAHRGVDVGLLLPGRSAHRTVLLAAQSYYESLLSAGVKVYEYQRGLLHSKMLTVDGAWSFVGSANFDNRSLRLNFEAGALFYGHRIARQLEQVFDADVKDARELTLDEWHRRGLARQVAESTCRLLSPIL
jgi:cardiolipin synthase